MRTIPKVAAVAIKPLEWKEVDGDFYAKRADLKITTDGKSWGISPKDYPPFGGYPHKTLEDAIAAAQAEHEADIRSFLAAPPVDPVKEKMAEALKNIAVEMRHILFVNPSKDGGLYRQRLTEAEAALSAYEAERA